MFKPAGAQGGPQVREQFTGSVEIFGRKEFRVREPVGQDRPTAAPYRLDYTEIPKNSCRAVETTTSPCFSQAAYCSGVSA
jgi:hypothetical protein